MAGCGSTGQTSDSDQQEEEISKKYGYQVNIGVIDCVLSKIRDLSGSYDVLIELAE